MDEGATYSHQLPAAETAGVLRLKEMNSAGVTNLDHATKGATDLSLLTLDAPCQVRTAEVSHAS
jgi:hypothetical protein